MNKERRLATYDDVPSIQCPYCDREYILFYVLHPNDVKQKKGDEVVAEHHNNYCPNCGEKLVMQD